MLDLEIEVGIGDVLLHIFAKRPHFIWKQETPSAFSVHPTYVVGVGYYSVLVDVVPVLMSEMDRVLRISKTLTLQQQQQKEVFPRPLPTVASLAHLLNNNASACQR